jgi:hypothetical protein
MANRKRSQSIPPATDADVGHGCLLQEPSAGARSHTGDPRIDAIVAGARNRLDIIAGLLVLSLERGGPPPKVKPRPRRTPRRQDRVTEFLDNLDHQLEEDVRTFSYQRADGEDFEVVAATRELADAKARSATGRGRRTPPFINERDHLACIRAFRKSVDDGRFPRFIAAIDAASKRENYERDGHAVAEALAPELVAAKVGSGWKLATGTCDWWRGPAVQSWLEVDVWILSTVHVTPHFTPRSFFYGSNLSPKDAETFALRDLTAWRSAVRNLEERLSQTRGANPTKKEG